MNKGGTVSVAGLKVTMTQAVHSSTAEVEAATASDEPVAEAAEQSEGQE